MLEWFDISKRFGAVTALQGVSFSIAPGSVGGILGENGAGKSTLMNILFGLLHPDAGSLRVDGRGVMVRSPRVARRLGLGMVHQHFKLVDTLSVLENIALAVGRGPGLIPRRRLGRQVQHWADQLGWRLDLTEPVGRLTVGQQQRVETIKALCAGGRWLILDEPTAVLTPQETENLLDSLRALAYQGMGVIFISHKLAEVRQICAQVLILRHGRTVYAGATAGLSVQAMAQKMIGRSLEPLTRAASGAGPSPQPRLELRAVCAGGGRRGGETLQRVNLSLQAGEIHGIAGVAGHGQDLLVRCLLGALRPTSGEVWLDPALGHWRHRVWPGACIPEDRRREGLIETLSVQSNLMLKDYRRRPFSVLGVCRFARWRQRATELVERFDIRCRDLSAPVGTLSGGNQQKVVLARELADTPPLILAVNPTRGLDVGATQFVLRQLLAARYAGAAILLIHSDLDELLSISDRVSVLYQGRLQATAWPAASRDDIGRLMLGV